ncbi:MAG: TIGR02099 family protein [Gammaproteobacteria bacterium]|nr:TIGR02099 family protein [Gammaproteobacteria bacterium]
MLLLALMLTVARVVLPQLEGYRPQIEAVLSERLHEKVTIADFDLSWHGFGPRLDLKTVHILDHATSQPMLGFSEARIDLNLWSSLRSWQPDFGKLTVVGAEITVIRKEDGEFEVVGVKLKDDKKPLDVEEILRWVWRQGTLAAERSTLHFVDRQRDNQSWTFSDVNLLLRNDGQKSRLTGRLNLPSQLGRGLDLAVEFERQGEAPRDWLVNYYFKSNDLALDYISRELGDQRFSIRHGLADVEMWGLWRSAAMSELRGRVGVHDLDFAVAVENEAEHVDRIPQVNAEFVWKHKDSGWDLEVDRLRVTHAGRIWPDVRAHLAVEQTAENVSATEVAVNQFQINDLVSWVQMAPGLNPEAKETLTALAPSGVLRDVMLRWQKTENKPALYLRAALDNVSTSPWRKIPGLKGVDAEINASQDSGVVDLKATDVAVKTVDLFRGDLPIKSAQGRIAWAKQEDGWHVDLRQVAASNDDIEAMLNGHVFVPAGDASPTVDVAAAFQDGNVAQAGRYLPVGIMSPSLVSWLDRALVKGLIPAGTLRMKGPLRQFPFADGSGLFEVQFAAKDTALDHGEGWPRIEEIAADLTFTGTGMKVHGKQARIFDANVHDVDVKIADFKGKSALELNGQAESSVPTVMRYLRESPLREMILGGAFDQATTAGSAQLLLGLKVPLEGDGKVLVSGDVTLKDAALTMPNYSVDSAQVNGALHFSESGIESKRLEGVVLGQPTRMAISTQSNKKSRYLVFRAQGDSRYAELAQRFSFIPIFGFMEGGSPWQAELKLAISGDQPESTLKVSSNLTGTAVRLPAPLAKSNAMRTPLTVRGRFMANNSTWQVDYGEMLLSALFSLEPTKSGELQLRRGDVRVGERAQLPKNPGIRIAGEFNSISDKDWMPVVNAFMEAAPKKVADTESSVELNQVALKAGVAKLGDMQFNDVTAEMEKIQGVWIANVDSKQLAGKISIPQKTGQTLEMNLSRLQLPRDSEYGDQKSKISGKPGPGRLAEKADPRKLPPLRINSEHLFYGESDLGKLTLMTEPRANGLLINTLELNSEHASLKAGGSWNRVGKTHTSALDVDLEIRDLGSVLGGLGYNSAVRKGEGRGQISLRWPGPIFEPDVKRMEGTMRFDVNDGSLLEVEPGAGRLFGLLSIQALPRRLTLDFRDFFSKGFSFDYMRGGFEIEDGNAVIQDFVLDGPAAKVTMQGRVGLDARDYDQQVVVMPHVSTGLPLVGVVAGGLGVGAAVLLAEKLFKSRIAEASEIHYSITGSWDAPVIKRQGDVLPQEPAPPLLEGMPN